MKEYWVTTSTLDSSEEFENHIQLVYNLKEDE
jgi:hypothetical protein